MPPIGNKTCSSKGRVRAVIWSEKTTGLCLNLPDVGRLFSQATDPH